MILIQLKLIMAHSTLCAYQQALFSFAICSCQVSRNEFASGCKWTRYVRNVLLAWVPSWGELPLTSKDLQIYPLEVFLQNITLGNEKRKALTQFKISSDELLSKPHRLHVGC